MGALAVISWKINRRGVFLHVCGNLETNTSMCNTHEICCHLDSYIDYCEFYRYSRGGDAFLAASFLTLSELAFGNITLEFARSAGNTLAKISVCICRHHHDLCCFHETRRLEKIHPSCVCGCVFEYCCCCFHDESAPTSSLWDERGASVFVGFRVWLCKVPETTRK